MKKLLLILLFPLTAYSQHYGFNATNTPENLTPTARGYINNIADEVFYFVFRNDKYQSKAPEYEITNVISLGNELALNGKELRVIYTFNPRTEMSISDNFYAADKFIEAGINVPIFRIGNETYFKDAGFNGNWDTYLNANLALIAEVDKRNKIVIIPYSENNLAWNAKCESYVNARSNYAPDVHIYYSKTECPILGALVNNSLAEELITGYSETKDNFYSSLYSQITASSHLQAIIDNHRAKFPTKQMYVTEYGAAVGVGEIGNVFGSEMANDWFMRECRNYPEIEVLCKFNLGSVTGVITDASKKDLVTGTVKRLGYFTIQNFLKYKEATAIKEIVNGTQYFYYHNPTRTDIGFNFESDLIITNVSYECIKADNWYSSSGATAWWSVGSEKSYEIGGMITTDYIPALSYGYITVIAIEKIYGCTIPSALNFNETANTNDGSCYFTSDCDCKDSEAINFNELAPCEDNSKCEYKAEQCLKKRWLFSGCKTSTRNCNCN